MARAKDTTGKKPPRTTQGGKPVTSKPSYAKGSKPMPSSPSNAKASDRFDFMEYVRGVRSEWQKISWPARPQVIAETVVVLLVVTVMTVAVYLLDNIYRTVFSLLS